MDAIVATDRSWAIGYRGDLLFRLSHDLKRFKELTIGHPVILGRKTLETFPGKKPLPGRPHFILSRDPAFQVENARVFHNEETLLAQAPPDSFLIGGESVYRLLLPHCRRVFLTKVDAVFPADAHFPNLDEIPQWKLVHASSVMEEDGFPFRYLTYENKELL